MLGNAYFAFAMFASLGALWVMQKTTPDAGFGGSIPLLKLAHRFSLAVVSVVLFAAGVSTLYSDTEPRPVDFLVIFVLTMVLALSAIRHMCASLPRSSHTMASFTLPK